MNFVPQASMSLIVMWIAIGVLLAALITLILANRPSPKRPFERQSIISIILSAVSCILLGVSGVSAIAFGIPNARIQRSSFYEQVQHRYGIELDPEQLRAFQYPISSPKKGLQTYGATVIEQKVEGNLYRKQKVQLISENGKLKLAHYEDGRGFQELPRKDQDR